jgi:GNAT superfamily N-acetyltransferase
LTREARPAAVLKPWQFLAYELRLEVDRFNREAFAPIEQRLADQGIAITTLARQRDLGAAAVEKAYALHDACYRRQPPVALRQTRLPFKLWAWGSLEAADALPDAYFIAVADGGYVGLTTAARIRRLLGTLECRFTGVLPEYAGRGIGMALKACSIRFALENGYRELRTTVLADNIAMLTINESLGFVRHREFIQSYPQLNAPHLLKA